MLALKKVIKDKDRTTIIVVCFLKKNFIKILQSIKEN